MELNCEPTTMCKALSNINKITLRWGWGLEGTSIHATGPNKSANKFPFFFTFLQRIRLNGNQYPSLIAEGFIRCETICRNRIMLKIMDGSNENPTL